MRLLLVRRLRFVPGVSLTPLMGDEKISEWSRGASGSGLEIGESSYPYLEVGSAGLGVMLNFGRVFVPPPTSRNPFPSGVACTRYVLSSIWCSTGSEVFWYRRSWVDGCDAGGRNGEDIGVVAETPRGKKSWRPGVDGRVEESGRSNGGSDSLTCLLRFSYEDEYSIEEVVMSSSTCW